MRAEPGSDGVASRAAVPSVCSRNRASLTCFLVGLLYADVANPRERATVLASKKDEEKPKFNFLRSSKRQAVPERKATLAVTALARILICFHLLLKCDSNVSDLLM